MPDKTNFSSRYVFHVFIISVGVSFLTFFSQIIVARNLNPRDFAVFASIGAVINVTGVSFSSILLNQVKSIKSHSGELSRNFFDRGTRGVLLFAVFVSVAFLLAVSLQNTGAPVLTILLAGVAIPMVALVTGLNAKFQGLGKLRVLNLSTLTTILISVIAQLFLIQGGLLSVNSALLVILLSNLLTLILFSLRLPPAGLANSSIFSAEALKLALLSSGFWFFVNADILLSPLWLEENQRGEYSAASSVAKILLIACGVLNGLLLNNLLNNKRSGVRFPFALLVKYLLVQACLALLFLVGIYFFGDNAFRFIFGSHLASEPGFLIQICVAGTFLVLAGIVVQVLIAYSNSWAPGVLLWLLCISFLGVGSIVNSKQDLVEVYAWGGGVISLTLLITAIYNHRKLSRG